MKYLSMIPVTGWLLAFIYSFLVSIPLWFLWARLGLIYFSWVPTVWLNIGFWDTVLMVWFISLTRSILFSGISLKLK